MAKFYEIDVEGTKYRIVSGNLAEATKKALAAHLDGKEEPKALSLRVGVREVPAVERVTP